MVIKYRILVELIVSLIKFMIRLVKRYAFQVIFFILVLIGWHIISKIVNIDYILPSPVQVLDYFNKEITLVDASKQVGMTLFRVTIGYSVALLFALVLSILATIHQVFEKSVNQIVIISKTLPTISIILIALIWLGRSKATFLIAILVVFPLLYEVFYNSIKNIDPKLVDVSHIYQFNFRKRLKYLYIPSVIMNFTLSLKQTFGLCFKVMVMAEVLGQAQAGIGSEIYEAKLYLEMAGVFSWTIILIFIVLLIDYLIISLIKTRKKWM
ncbi:ABC transporter permease [Haloplasma contractile]|uniref:Binding-protein-dependent transport system inner membrane protein n=1 Tax=Haloplasma contractile SSD-17B TaxID=1033810 RepID=U2DRA0_9MOLU|nr:ABC transporter permease subunit [Haloplasma contractile]ERJ11102.1 binding-protein-dependent transport system inner membrane protein [Haloplasma contractile SSD-17B]